MPTWIDAAERFAIARGLGDELLGVLRCFCGPEPRGGPPAPPEDPFDGEFEELERLRLEDSLAGVATALHGEVDLPQAEMFARRLRAVDHAIAALGDDVGRLLRVGLRQRVRGISSAPTARATRIRALADFYYSYAGLHRHRREGGRGPAIEVLVAAIAWRSIVPGIDHARLQGASDLGPVHVNLLRLDPARVQLSVEDLRPAVAAGQPFASYVEQRGAIAGVSGGFFLYSEPDIVAPSRRFDPVGLLLQDGRLVSPPAFRRGAVLVDRDGRVSIDRIGMTDVEIETPHGLRWRPTAIHNRAGGTHGPPTPSAAIVGDRVLACGRSLAVPLNGFVLPLPGPEVLAVGDRVRYPTVHGPTGPVHSGIAGGPMLLCAGELALEMRAEDFWGTAPPVTFSQDETGDRNLLPRLAAGLTPRGALVLAAIDGRNLERALGMTLAGVARLLTALGCEVATNLDGGSSKRMVVQGHALDLASTEIVGAGVAEASVRPVHTGMLVTPR